ncbi:MAG: hypothetical protein QG622_2493 [Actinomycetota bacterium]|nr:hypothetical protein [Actinomycetota bacterium]
MRPTHTPHDLPSAYHEDQFHLLTLCLELQLDLLLVALRPPQSVDAPPARGVSPFPRWVGGTLDLTAGPVDGRQDDGPPGDRRGGTDTDPGHEPSWLAWRYSAIARAIDEMLGNGEVRKNPAVLDRLVQARSTCDERLAALPRSLSAKRSVRGFGDRFEAGHYLG